MRRSLMCIYIYDKDKNLIARKNGIIVDNPKLAIIKVLDYFSLNDTDDTDETGIHDSAQINPNAIIGKTITVQYFEESKNQQGELSLRFPTVKHVFKNGRNV